MTTHILMGHDIVRRNVDQNNSYLKNNKRVVTNKGPASGGGGRIEGKHFIMPALVFSTQE